jgi:hypothetical protein
VPLGIVTDVFALTLAFVLMPAFALMLVATIVLALVFSPLRHRDLTFFFEGEYLACAGTSVYRIEWAEV